jgi:adenosine kinase
MAYDTIMVFPDQFKNHILPDKIHILNVAFLVPEMRREFGGTAGNIAYNLNLLGDSPRIMATVGDDFASYAAWLQKNAISDEHIRHVADSFTAQAFITTDRDDNQITAFHPGAMNFAHYNKVADTKGVSLGIIAPDGRDGMFQHADEFKRLGIPFMFDPGQGLPMFNGEELLHFIELADYMAFNDYEAQMMQDKTGLSLDALASKVKALIVTLGVQGSHIYASGQRIEIPCVKAEAVVDPTGCGDAYRSGLLYGITHGWDWKMSGQLASVMGSIKIASRGGQNHRPSKQDIASRYQAAFGEMLAL